ncbi:MAG: GAF domain-containing protein, partial [Planctomycetota bacterium]
MNASAETTERQGDDAEQSALGGDLSGRIEGRVGMIAKASASQTEFLRRLATEFSEAFELDAVGVTHPDWDTPMILISANVTTSRIDGEGVIQILGSATSAPTACNVPIWTDGRKVNSRGLHVQLSNQNGVSAVILLYAHDRSPSTVEQVGDLKRLAEYAAHCRTAIAELPDGSGSEPSRSQSNTHAISVGQNRTLRSFHRDLDLKGTAYRIVNESRRLLQADRVSLLIEKHRNFRMLAVSGVAVVDRRANAVKDAEHFANRVAVLDRPLLLPSDDPLPPQIQDSLDQYLDESDVASVLVYPMYLPRDAVT